MTSIDRLLRHRPVSCGKSWVVLLCLSCIVGVRNTDYRMKWGSAISGLLPGMAFVREIYRYIGREFSTGEPNLISADHARYKLDSKHLTKVVEALIYVIAVFSVGFDVA